MNLLNVENTNEVKQLNLAQKKILQSCTEDNNYLTQVRLDYKIAIDAIKLEQACNKVCLTYPYLLSKVINKNNKPQFHYTLEKVKFSYLDLSQNKHKEKHLEDLLENDFNNFIPIYDNPLVRFMLIKIDCKKYTLVFTHHHILLDYKSLAKVAKEITDTYLGSSYTNKLAPSKKRLLHQEINSFDQLSKVESIASLPGRLSQQSKSSKIIQINFTFPENTLSLINKICSENKTSVSSVFYAAWVILLCKYGYNNYSAFGIIRRIDPAINKGDLDLAIATLPLLGNVDISTTTQTLLAELTSQLQNPCDISNSLTGIFDCILDYKNDCLQTLLDEAFPQIFSNATFRSITDRPLVVEIWKSKETFSARISFSSTEFYEECIQDMEKSLYKIIKFMASSPTAILSQICLVDSPPYQHTQTKIFDKSPLYNNFLKNANESPNSTAVTCQQKTLSYSQLKNKAAFIARLINEFCSTSSCSVAIFIPKSIELIIALVGAQASRAIVVPLDPEHTTEWKRSILDQVKPKLIIVNNTTKHSINDIPSINIDTLEFNNQITFKNTKLLKPTSHIIFTSGSTSKPKGVYIKEEGLVNTVNNLRETLKVNSNHRFLMVASVAFDMALMDLWLPLSIGAELFVADDCERRDTNALVHLIHNAEITCMAATPALWQDLIKNNLQPFKRPFKLMSGGEALTSNLAKKMLAIGETFNLYGPTENSVYTTIDKIEDPSDITIGKPIENVTTFITDKFHKLAPRYALGELNISGIGLSAGYINSQSSFTIYRSGDLAFYRSDCKLCYQGRIDQQFKINGYRIDLNAIKFALEKTPLVSSAIVTVVYQDEYHKKIIAYIVPTSLQNLSESKTSIMQYVSNQLPYYMLPTAYKFISKIPLTINGKINYKQLPVYEINTPNIVSEITDSTIILTRIWQEILNLDSISLDANFFELGGDSFFANKLLNKLRFAFPIEFSIVDLYRYPTLSQQADYINKLTSAANIELQHTTFNPRLADNDIAIIGFACRFPEINNLAELWDAVSNQKVLYTKHDSSHTNIKNFIPVSGILDSTYLFDNQIFNFSNAEAESLNPQHRIFLELCWEVLQQTAYLTQKGQKNNIGVFAGASENYYGYNVFTPTNFLSMNNLQHFISNNSTTIASRIAYKLNLTGPAICIDTACSTSLVNIIKACQSIVNGECEMALAGGISLVLPEHAGYLYQKGSIFSSDGFCRVFDDSANGTVPSSGGGVVLLKSFNSAIKDNDTIHGVIKGYAINNDGADKASFSAPSVEGQIDCLSNALQHSKLSIEDISYIEAHGTGTKIGDPIEFFALNEVFKENKNKIGLGSIKSNLGHTNHAAGVAGLIKVLAMMKNNIIPAQALFKQANANIDLNNSSFQIFKENSHWATTNKFAGISSFGIGGTNAHLIISDYQNNPTKRKANISALPKWNRKYFNIDSNPVTFPKQRSNKLQNSLVSIWQNLFKNFNINTQDSFFDLGGDSLTALEFCEQVERIHNISLDPRILYNKHTIFDLAEYIDSQSIHIPTDKFITCIQDRDASQNIFLIHPIGGTSFCYIPISKEISSQFNVYLVNDPMIIGDTSYTSIKALAERYAEEILKIQPNGVYHLAGLSLGGVLAIEIASSIEKLHRKLGFIGLIESWARTPSDFLDSRIFIDTLHRQHEILAKELQNPKFIFDSKPWINLQHERMQQLLQHHQVSFDFPIILFKAKETNSYFKPIDDDYNHWRYYAKGPITKYICTGNHETIIYQDNGKELVKLINKHLNNYKS